MPFGFIDFEEESQGRQYGTEEVQRDKYALFIAKREIPWQNAWAGSWDTSPMLRDYGVTSIPAILLIGPADKVLLANPSVEELKRNVDEIRVRGVNE